MGLYKITITDPKGRTISAEGESYLLVTHKGSEVSNIMAPDDTVIGLGLLKQAEVHLMALISNQVSPRK